MDDVAIDLYCGLGGWADGFLSEGFQCIGFDIERHDYGTGGYPGQLILQDVLTICGTQFRSIADRLRMIVASPPCQKYSYMAMPWKKAKALAAWYRESPERIAELNALFNACFRIQSEASEAAGRHIPLIVENVRGAEPWVGRAAWHFGSYHLWGDIPALMPVTRAQKFNPDGTGHPQGSWFAIADSKKRGAKTNGQDWSRFAQTGEVSPHWRMEGLKGPETEWRANGTRAASNRMVATDEFCGLKGFTPNGEPLEKNTLSRASGSNSLKRKQASAMIAKIPFPLSQHIARCFKSHADLSTKNPASNTAAIGSQSPELEGAAGAPRSA